MQSSILSSNALSSRSHHRARFNGAAARGKTSSSKRQQALRVVAKDFPKPEQIDKTENYRIAGELSKRVNDLWCVPSRRFLSSPSLACIDPESCASRFVYESLSVWKGKETTRSAD